MVARATCLIADSLDDLLRAVIAAIVKDGEPVLPTQGSNRELRAVTLQLTNPRARLSRSESRGNVFSALGELLWYLSGSEASEFIKYYIPAYPNCDAGGAIVGAYGPRLRGGSDQLAAAISLLRRKPATRRAVIQIFDRDDLTGNHQEVPCTCLFQFLVRNDALDLVVYMRSNDAFIGLPHDIFCFSMIQELVARAVGVSLGQYIHVAGSLHLYDRNAEAAQNFLEEGFYHLSEMPQMPDTDPMAAVDQVLTYAELLRSVEDPLSVDVELDEYWGDLTRLLVVLALIRRKRREEVESVLAQMTTEVYRLHVQDRLDKLPDR